MHSAVRVGLGDQTKLPRKQVVIPTRRRAQSLVQILQLARTDGHSLIRLSANQLPVTDALGPGGPAEGNVVRARKGVCLGVGQALPRSGQTVGSPGAEVPLPVAADGFHEKQILPVSGVVDVGRLEQGVLVGVGQGNHCIAHAVGEVGQRGLRAVQMAVVVRGEQVAVA